jgi:hypothetical protein
MMLSARAAAGKSSWPSDLRIAEHAERVRARLMLARNSLLGTLARLPGGVSPRAALPQRLALGHVPEVPDAPSVVIAVGGPQSRRSSGRRPGRVEQDLIAKISPPRMAVEVTPTLAVEVVHPAGSSSWGRQIPAAPELPAASGIPGCARDRKTAGYRCHPLVLVNPGMPSVPPPVGPSAGIAASASQHACAR